MYTVTFTCKNNTLEDVSGNSLALHAHNFGTAIEKKVLPKFTNRPSWTWHKISKCKGFFSAKISCIWDRIKEHIMEDMHQRKPLYLHILPSVRNFTY